MSASLQRPSSWPNSSWPKSKLTELDIGRRTAPRHLRDTAPPADLPAGPKPVIIFFLPSLGGLAVQRSESTQRARLGSLGRWVKAVASGPLACSPCFLGFSASLITTSWGFDALNKAALLPPSQALPRMGPWSLGLSTGGCGGLDSTKVFLIFGAPTLQPKPQTLKPHNPYEPLEPQKPQTRNLQTSQPAQTLKTPNLQTQTPAILALGSVAEFLF